MRAGSNVGEIYCSGWEGTRFKETGCGMADMRTLGTLFYEMGEKDKNSEMCVWQWVVG